jgi:hypothetical protein
VSIGGRSPRGPVARRYTLGPSPLVRGTCSSKSTGCLDFVLDGHLDLCLAPTEDQCDERPSSPHERSEIVVDIEARSGSAHVVVRG